MEAVVWCAARVAPSATQPPTHPASIFVLRNNDIGDLIVVTPLFEALRRTFPQARIVAGVGDWNRPTLQHNPHVDEVVTLNAPWHNHPVPDQTPVNAFSYIATSKEVAAVRARRFDVGIDVVGSPLGSLLLLRAGIPWRLGVRGYAGGHSGVQQWVDFDEHVHVGRASLRFAELLGATQLPPNHPQLFLTAAELVRGEQAWSSFETTASRRRIVLSPGGGLPEKRWPAERFRELAARLGTDPGHQVAVIGTREETAVGETLAGAAAGATSFAGRTTLREAFALIACSDLVVCNSSMAMHVAAAFDKPAVVLLGQSFPSARQHAALWGHPLSRIHGKDAGRPDIASVDEALDAVLHAG